MKRVVIAILLATVFAGTPVFAESRDANLNGVAAVVISNPAAARSPQFRRRHYRLRRYRVRRYRVRRYRVRRYRRVYVMRRGRRRMRM
jgi:hypothetical protein